MDASTLHTSNAQHSGTGRVRSEQQRTDTKRAAVRMLSSASMPTHLDANEDAQIDRGPIRIWTARRKGQAERDEQLCSSFDSVAVLCCAALLCDLLSHSQHICSSPVAWQSPSSLPLRSSPAERTSSWRAEQVGLQAATGRDREEGERRSDREAKAEGGRVAVAAASSNALLWRLGAKRGGRGQ